MLAGIGQLNIRSKSLGGREDADDHAKTSVKSFVATGGGVGEKNARARRSIAVDDHIRLLWSLYSAARLSSCEAVVLQLFQVQLETREVLVGER